MSNNLINKVAIVGASGHIGSHFVSHLLATGKHTITAITRLESTATFPPDVIVSHADYTSTSSITAAFQGQDFLIITLPGTAPPELHTKLIQAAVRAGIRWVMPNIYGADPLNAHLNDTSVVGPVIKAGLKDVRDAGINWVVLTCGFWYEWSLALGEDLYGFDIKNKKAVICDEGRIQMNTSTFDRCGEAVAKLLSLPISSESESESGSSGPVLEDWKSKPLYVSSFRLSQRDILESLHRVMGTTDKDWQIEFQSSEDRVKEGLERLGKGDRLGFAKALYSRGWYPTRDYDFETRRDLDNEKLGLGSEDLDTITKLTVDMVREAGNVWQISFSPRA